ncbi:MAG: LCP family protein [Humibacillus sp.]|nr:LCP family protein [Humibacillus sp.]MDN5779230.1 LCP family protein [Humibacillus sp.]
MRPPHAGAVAAGAAILVTLVLGSTWLFGPPSTEDVAVALALAAVERNDVNARDLDLPTGSDPEIYLVVGSDQRRVRVGSARDIRGERADAIMVWAFDGTAPVRVLSIPRDVRVHVVGHGDGKLGGALEYGGPAMIEAVRSLTGLPIHHYVELEFAALTRAVERVGGVEVDVPHPVRDRHSGLRLRGGAQKLDGAQALSYIRSREYEELIDGRWVMDPSGDLGRMRRQHLVLAQLPGALKRCGGLGCVSLLPQLGAAVTVDEAFTTRDLSLVGTAVAGTRTALWMRVLPSAPARAADDSLSPFPPVHLGNVGYRLLDQPAASRLVRSLRSSGGR